MLTIFSVPKAFVGRVGVIQTYALRSWCLLHPEVEIILLGDDNGVAKVANQFGVVHIPKIQYSVFGTPILSSVFYEAQKASKYDLVCYVNADIILMSDFIDAVQRIYKSAFVRSITKTKKEFFLMVGQRYDVDLDYVIEFEDKQWQSRLREYVGNHGQLHSKSGCDFFVFPRGLYNNPPSFSIGRGGWDNWLIYQARLSKVPVIDVSRVVMPIHANHDYSHIKDGTTSHWKGVESEHNLQLMGGEEHAFTIEYATWILTEFAFLRQWTLRKVYLELGAWFVMTRWLHFLSRPMRVLTTLIIKIRRVFALQQ